MSAPDAGRQARVAGFVVEATRARVAWVEVDVQQGPPSFRIAGMPSRSSRETFERVRRALTSSGYEMPASWVTADIAPASIHRAGAELDAALAVAVLAASGQIPSSGLDRWGVFGQLGIDGAFRPTRGTLAAAEAASAAVVRGLIVPPARLAEAALGDCQVATARHLRDITRILYEGPAPRQQVARPVVPSPTADVSDLRGNGQGVRALEIAAAGDHHLLLCGPRGSGRTALARRLTSVLPPMTRTELLEVTRIHSIAGTHDGAKGAITARPFRAPHHTISTTGLGGGGAAVAPGEVTLAHHGVLMLDELAEFASGTLDVLRRPLADGSIVFVRGERAHRFPARFALVAAASSCPCGNEASRCSCSDATMMRFRRRLAPTLGWFDLIVPTVRPTAAQLAAPPATSSRRVRDRVEIARERKRHREEDPARAQRDRLQTQLAVRAQRAISDGNGHEASQPVLRLARTIADLEERDRVELDHVLEAADMRSGLLYA